MFDFAMTPTGHLILFDTGDAGGAALDEEVGASLARAFDKGSAEGLLRLTAVRHDAILPAAFSFWRRFGDHYLTALCHIPEPLDIRQSPIPAPREDLETMADAAPPMRGGEYLRTATLERLWVEMDIRARGQIAECKGGLSEWLRARSPLWRRVGRVCFHLAENKSDAERPFAFLATYAKRLLDRQRVQYQPLGRALEEYAGAGDRKTLINLLSPVQRAAEQCAWVKALVESSEVFHPLRWSPQEAYRFLKDASLLEESGLILRIPDWWTKHPPRARVAVTIGNARQPRFDAKAMLDFKVELTLDGETLTREETKRLLAGSDGLVFLRGRWVEVDGEKLKAALAHWKKVENEVGLGGVSFIEGMRWLAGAPLHPEADRLFSASSAAWSEVRAGAWIEERLRALREPGAFDASLPTKELRATLRPYQAEGVKWLRFLAKIGLGACLADDMGLGKTIQILALLLLIKKERRSAGKSAPALLVLPASLLANWKAEMERFAPSLVFRFVHPSQTGTDDMKKAAGDPRAFLDGADVALTTYGMLSRLEWLSAPSWSLLVLDEAQAIKNPAARQTRAVKRLKAQARIVLTGTPVENRLTDLWSIFDFLCPGLLGSAKEFSGLVKRLEKRERDQYAPLRRLVGPYILRRLKTDKSVIADLPDKTEVMAFCHLTKRQAVLYEQAVRELAGALGAADGIQRRGIILAFILRFKQICNHPAQWLAAGGYVPAESGKFVRLGEICDELAARQEKTLVFTQFREMTVPLAEFLKTVFGHPGLVLHGQVAVGKRKKLVDEFQSESGPPFFVLSLKAGGAGLNLAAASHVIHFDRWWNPAVENQATDRAYRIGQRKNVMVHKFVCQGTIEEKIDEMIRDKSALAEELLEGGAPTLITELTDAELLNLVRLDASAINEE
ncbi:MAG: DEAD/DEAH box helicase [Nitrospinae bacterium]|nr:DEAD/DEAH box helicase [Nitrospinota bacterium]